MLKRNDTQAEHAQLLKAVGAWVQHPGEREAEDLDRALRPLSDDPVERGDILRATRAEVVQKLSDAEIDAIGAPDLARVHRAFAEAGESSRRVLRRGPLGDARYDQWDLLDAGIQALQAGVEGVRRFCDRWLGIRKGFDPEHLAIACCEVLPKLAPREAWPATADESPRLVEPLPPFWQEAKVRPDDYVGVSVRHQAEKEQRRDEDPLKRRGMRRDEQADVEMLEALAPEEVELEFEALILRGFEEEEATPREAELLEALRTCMGSGGSPADALRAVGRNWSAWQSLQRRIRRYALNAAT